MKLGQMLYVGFAIPTLCLVGLGTYSLYSFDNIDRQVQTIYDDRVVPLQQLKLISDDYAISIIDAVNKAHAERLTMNQALQSVNRAMKRIEENWQSYKATQLTLQEEKIARDVEELFRGADREIEELQQALQVNDPSVLDEFDGSLYDAIDPLTSKIQELITLQLEVAKEEREKAAEVYQRTRQIFIPLLLMALLIGSPIGFALVRVAIAATLQELVNAVASSSSQIAAATTEQERIAQQQASAVHQTTRTMDRLNEAFDKAVTEAEASSSCATQALTLAANGTKAVGYTLGEMTAVHDKVKIVSSHLSELSDRTSQIGNIATLVRDFATQTNVLALNAAVEAVRAGEYGKGFGVVASEIRKLADQSHNSAEKINALVADIEIALNSTVVASNESSNSVEEGIRIARETAAAFDGVRDAVNQVVLSCEEISLSSKEQAIAIQQVLIAMNDLNEGAAQTASGISQVTIGTQRLNEAALNLKAVV